MKFSLVSVLLAQAILFLSGCTTPSMELSVTPTSPALRRGDPGYDTTLQVRWLGTTAYVLQLGDKVLFTDPFVTHQSLLRVGLGGKIASNPFLVAEKLRGVPVPAAIFVGHSHYDHVLDATTCLQQGGWESVPVYGGETTRHILCGSGQRFTNNWRQVVADRRWHQVAPGIRYRAVTVTHARQVRFLPLFHRGRLKECHCGDSAGSYKVGETYAYMFELTHQGVTKTIYITSTAHDGDESFRGGTGFPNVAILPAASWKNACAYPREVLQRLQPRHVIASHYNDFFQTDTNAPRALAQAKLPEFLSEVQASADYPHFQGLHVPPVDGILLLKD